MHLKYLYHQNKSRILGSTRKFRRNTDLGNRKIRKLTHKNITPAKLQIFFTTTFRIQKEYKTVVKNVGKLT